MRSIVTLAALLAASAASATEPPDEATKVRALLLGYTLNGNSMVRPLSYGSIDVSHLLNGTRPTPAEIEFEKPSAAPADPRNGRR